MEQLTLSPAHSTQTEYVAVHGGVVITIADTGAVFIGGTRVKLKPMEEKMLLVLAQANGAVLTKAMLVKALYAQSRPPQTDTIKVFLCNLRKQLRSLHPEAEKVIGHQRNKYWFNKE